MDRVLFCNFPHGVDHLLESEIFLAGRIVFRTLFRRRNTSLRWTIWTRAVLFKNFIRADWVSLWKRYHVRVRLLALLLTQGHVFLQLWSWALVNASKLLIRAWLLNGIYATSLDKCSINLGARLDVAGASVNSGLLRIGHWNIRLASGASLHIVASAIWAFFICSALVAARVSLLTGLSEHCSSWHNSVLLLAWNGRHATLGSSNSWRSKPATSSGIVWFLPDTHLRLIEVCWADCGHCSFFQGAILFVLNLF